MTPVADRARATTDAGRAEAGALSVSGNYLAGYFARRSFDTAAAARYLDQALAGNPDNAELAEQAFNMRLASGDITLAVERAQQVLRADERHRLANILLGLRDIKAGRHKAARRRFRTASYLREGKLAATLLTAWSYAAQKQLTTAMRTLEALDAHESFRSFKTFHAALIADFLNSPSRAAKLYRTTYDSAKASLRVTQAFAGYLTRRNQRARALDVLDQYLTNRPGDAVIGPLRRQIAAGRTPMPLIAQAHDGMAEAMYSIANALSEQNDFDIALIYARLALAVRPDFPMARLWLGETYNSIGRYEEAVAAFGQIGPDSPLWSDAEIAIANSLRLLGRNDEALKRLDVLLEKQPGNSRASIARGDLQRATAKWQDAAHSYSQALSAPDQAQNWALYYSRGIAYERSKQWPRAEADFKRALALQPDEPGVLNYLGYSWIEQGTHLRQALRMVKKAVSLRPDDGYIVDSLGWAYYRLGDYDKAVEHLENAVNLRPVDATINEHLGDAYWRSGRKREARFQWRHALDYGPEPENLERVRRKLEQGLTDDPDRRNPPSMAVRMPKDL